MFALNECLGGIYMRVEPSKDGNDVDVCLDVSLNFSLVILTGSVA